MPMKYFLILCILLWNLRPVAAGTNTSSQWSIRYLARASNFLLTASDLNLQENKSLCDFKPDEPAQLSLPLRALIDEKLKTLSVSQMETIYNQTKLCKKECSCDIYALVLESPRRTDSNVLKEIETQGKQLQISDRKRCAENFSEFCRSRLLKYLKLELSNQ